MPVIEITAVAHGGDGVGRVDGQVCFVPFALPGDVVEVRVERQAKNAMWGVLEKVLEASPDRVAAACVHHGRCGACLWGHFAYPAQAEWKRRIVREALTRLAGIETEVEWREDAALRLGYRTRAEFHADGERIGFYALNTHEIVEMESHPLSHPRLNEVFAGLRPLRLKGAVTVTVNPEGDDVLIWTVAPLRRLADRFPGADTPRDERRSGFVFDGVPIVNGTFSQASLLLNRLLVAEVRTAVGAAGNVLDLYCGNGNLSIGLPERVEVAGMDHNKEAVHAAQRLSGRDYRAGDEARMAGLARGKAWDVIVLDPPRVGAKALAPALAECKAGTLVYVSCDPATLARDLRVLAGGGWRVARVAALDLFPNTPHVEVVCVLRRG